MFTEKLKRYGAFDTHDVLKLIGLLFMVVDHIGIFAFPHVIWLRAIGRAAAPVFFFLIGYSGSYRFHLDIFLAALLLVAVKFTGTHSLSYSTLLVGFIIARLLLEQVERGYLSLKRPWVAFLLLVVLWPLSWSWFEYGTIGLMFSLCGYMQKHADRYGFVSRLSMLIISFVIYGFMACVVTMRYPSETELAILTITLISCGALLWHYHPYSPVLPEKWRRFEPALAWPARYSLWIYALHLAVLHIVTGVYF